MRIMGHVAADARSAVAYIRRYDAMLLLQFLPLIHYLLHAISSRRICAMNVMITELVLQTVDGVHYDTENYTETRSSPLDLYLLSSRRIKL
jgi:hypothetical protein